MRLSLTVSVLVAALASARVVAADSPQPAAVPLPEDRLGVAGTDGVPRPFGDLLGADGRAVCFAFLHPACPLAQEYAPVLESLAADFAGQGVRVVGVVCECDDSGRGGNPAEWRDFPALRQPQGV